MSFTAFGDFFKDEIVCVIVVIFFFIYSGKFSSVLFSVGLVSIEKFKLYKILWMFEMFLDALFNVTVISFSGATS